MNHKETNIIKMFAGKSVYRILLVTLVFIISGKYVSAQEIVEPLRSNPLLINSAQKNMIAKRAITDTFDITDTRPFFDDFSQSSYFPKDSLWLDRNVFINSTSAHFSPSYGVATFDGLNEFGVPYKPGSVEEKGKTCDTLTSVPINLKDFQESDSLYLSFFYQSQGYGEEPDTYDSLVLEFKPDRLWMGSTWDSTAWVRVWSVPGAKMFPFKQAILPVKHYKVDSNSVPIQVANYYHGGFQFRFVNYGNLSGNLDNWHIDYVYLNKSRNLHDDVYEDITVVKLPQSLLKDYTSIPAPHLLADTTLFTDEQFMYIRNLFSSAINVRGTYLVRDLSNQHILLYNANSSINSEAQSIKKLGVHDSISLQFPFYQLKGDTIMLRTEAFSYYLQDIHKENDKVTQLHEFSNFYSYDDGSAENGYSVDIGDYNKARVAYHFKMGKNVDPTDSLRGISIYFNYSEEDASDRPFTLMVWKDYNSAPVRMIETATPIVSDSLYNGFYTYRFEHPVSIDSFSDANGNFYIGWEQTIAYRMNIGLDRNYFEVTGDSLPNKANTNIHYYTNNSWKTSAISGALMMRPIISKYKLVLPIGIEPVEKNELLNAEIYPNPASDHLSVYTGTSSEVTLVMTDMQGRERKRQNIINSSVITLDGLNPGMYIVILTDSRSQRKYYHKLIIQQ